MWVSCASWCELPAGIFPSVWLVEDRDGQLEAVARRVEIGESKGDAVEVLSGLDGSERVVVRGNEGLRDGQPVRIVTDPGR